VSVEELDAAGRVGATDPDVDVPSGSSSADSVGADFSGAGSSEVADPRGSARGRSARAPQPLLRVVREYAILAVIAVLLASLVRAFLGQAYYIPSESMVPTLQINDRVIVSRVSYHLGDPKRGDIIVFQNPDFLDRSRKDPVSRMGRNVLELLGVAQPKDKYYIKRAIGVPGDRVSMKDGHVWINGKQLAEPWLKADVFTEAEGDYGTKVTTLGKNQYFMMGDNRQFSKDSRFFGPITRSKMVGKAFLRIYPLGRFGGLGPSGS
jgi:signal peptidase I